ncbi:putative signaling protein [Methylobacterium isbiliense]|uniref:Signaling protein n=2 Tax=Methylobacterium isbiliense TaxID=315478 RepID=A0ABQ4SEZ7_9HYPH|nr:putative signaling protein [Methylobacterium isbiliense]
MALRHAGRRAMGDLFQVVAERHDLRLLGLSLLLGVLASLTAVDLAHHARAAAERTRGIWLALAAVASGFGLWASHVVAVLASRPGGPLAEHAGPTILSAVAMIMLTGAGLRTSVSVGRTWGPSLGGALIGGGLAVAHAIGLGSYAAAGAVTVDPLRLIAAALIAALLGALALSQVLRDGPAHQKTGCFILTLALPVHHFLAASGVRVGAGSAEARIADHGLASQIGFASLTLLVLAFTSVMLDSRARRRREQQELMESLANAAVEGIAVCDGDRIVTANTSLVRLLGRSAESLAGRSLSEIVPADVMERGRVAAGAAGSDGIVEADLPGPDGRPIPVEMILRTIAFAGRPHLAIAVRDLRARQQAEQHIQFLARHDALTRLPNRTSFNERVEQEIELAKASGRPLAVLCLDLDRFKDVNDLFGHAAGDAMLQAVASCIPALLDERQMMARLGGDEFAILAPGFGEAEAVHLAERILEAIRAENQRASGLPPISTSIGIAFSPRDADEREALMSHADAALYHAKAEGRGNYQFYDAVLGTQIRDRRSLEHDLRLAVSRGEFTVLYQPQMDVMSGELVGFEALLRWNHPERGSVPPDHFIPVAEETGAILAIGDWVLRETCREAAGWERPLRVAVNVSAVQLHGPDFAQTLHEILLQTGLRPGRLELEITETALVRDPARALATLRRLKALGVRVAMDDFGTGYSSLSNLRAFPFDKIKIDRSFIRAVDVNTETAAILRAVLGLGRGLGLPVLAEGVETPAELSFLGAEACQEAQGYLLGRPAPIEDFAEAIRLGRVADAAIHATSEPVRTLRTASAA